MPKNADRVSPPPPATHCRPLRQTGEYWFQLEEQRGGKIGQFSKKMRGMEILLYKTRNALCMHRSGPHNPVITPPVVTILHPHPPRTSAAWMALGEGPFTTTKGAPSSNILGTSAFLDDPGVWGKASGCQKAAGWKKRPLKELGGKSPENLSPSRPSPLSRKLNCRETQPPPYPYHWNDRRDYGCAVIRKYKDGVVCALGECKNVATWKKLW